MGTNGPPNDPRQSSDLDSFDQTLSTGGPGGVCSRCRRLAPFRSPCLNGGQFAIRYRNFRLQRKEYER
jgi:hypothetical protein